MQSKSKEHNATLISKEACMQNFQRKFQEVNRGGSGARKTCLVVSSRQTAEQDSRMEGARRFCENIYETFLVFEKSLLILAFI